VRCHTRLSHTGSKHFKDLSDRLDDTSSYPATGFAKGCQDWALYLADKTQERLQALSQELQNLIKSGSLHDSFHDGSTSGIPCMLIAVESIEADKAESIEYYGGIDGRG
jgi:hypothetical protein